MPTQQGQPRQRTGLSASYARKSTTDDPGLKSQHLVNSQKAVADGYLIPTSPQFRFEDDETSGRKTSREDLDRLLALVRSGEAPFDRIYIKDKTREGRFADPRFHLFLQVLCEQHGVQICYSDREVQLDFSRGLTPDMVGLFLKDILDGIMASEEVTRLIKRVTEGSRIWAMRKFYPGSRAPYGLERWYACERTGEFLEVVDESGIVRKDGQRFRLRFRQDETVDIVVEIFAELDAGHSLASVAKRLNDRGVTSPGGGRWAAEAIRRIARNPIYTGTLVWGRTTRDAEPVAAAEVRVDGEAPVLVSDAVPDAPIDLELFDRVQRLLDGNVERWDRRRRSAPAYPLSGLIECGVCGAGWNGSTRPSGHRVYVHQKSPRTYERRCPNRFRTVRAEAVENAVSALFEALLRDDGLRTATEEAVEQMLSDVREDGHERKIQRLEKQQARIARGLDRLVEDRAFAEDKDERTACTRRIQALNTQAAELERQLRTQREAQERLQSADSQMDLLSDRVHDLSQVLHSADGERQKQAYREIIKRIVIARSLEDVTVEVSPL